MHQGGDAGAAEDPRPRACSARPYEPRRPEDGVLHSVLRDHLESFLAEASAAGDGLPLFVERELREFLSCGILARGFARFRCNECGHELLVAVLGGCRVFDGNSMRMTPSGPAFRLVFLPKAETTVIDTWHVGGLRGTGSHDYEIKDAFVPESRTCWFTDPPRDRGPLYQMPSIALFGTMIASVSLGIARHAIEAMVQLSQTKVPARSTEPLKTKSPAQVQLGEAEGLLRAGRAVMREALAEAWHVVIKTGRTTWQDRGALWLASTQAATQACEAVDLVFKAGGASSPYASAGLERCLRDIRVAGQHICVASTNFEITGQQVLGADVGNTIWAMDDRGE